MTTAVTADPQCLTGPARATVRSDAVYQAAGHLFPSAGRRHPGAWSCSDAARSRFADWSAKLRAPIISRGKGARVVDVDGNEYVDYAASDGAMILGHADERIVVAVNKAVSKGCDLQTPSEAEVRLAEAIVSRFPAIDRARFFVSCADALSYSVRLAIERVSSRTAGGRHASFEDTADGATPPAVVLFDAYDDNLALMAHALATVGCPCRRIVLPSNDIGRLRDCLAEYGRRMAAVIVDPAVGQSGARLLGKADLDALRNGCDENGALLIFDETTAGFRVAPAGAATRYGVTPDLTVLGGILGGGLPLAACGGPDRIMKPTDSPESVLAALPTSVSPLSLASAMATVEATGESGFHVQLDERSSRLDAGLRAAAAAARVRTRHAHGTGMVSMDFVDDSVIEKPSAGRSEPVRFTRYYHAMLDRGVFLSPTPGSWMFVSAAHTDEDIDRTIEAARAALVL